MVKKNNLMIILIIIVVVLFVQKGDLFEFTSIGQMAVVETAPDTYSFTGDWTNEANVVDGDWVTFGYCPSNDGCTVILTYLGKAAYVSTSKWRIKTYRDGLHEVDLDIPSACWNAYADRLEFRLTSDASPTRSLYECYDGTAYQTIYANTPAGAARNRVYEQAMMFDDGGVPTCGDGECNGNEDTASCPDDCVEPCSSNSHCNDLNTLNFCGDIDADPTLPPEYDGDVVYHDNLGTCVDAPGTPCEPDCPAWAWCDSMVVLVQDCGGAGCVGGYGEAECVGGPACDDDGVCEAGETHANCPNDCECDVAGDCGTNGLVGSPYCQGDDVYQDYRTYSCTSNDCSFVDTPQIQQACQYGCSGGSCVGCDCTSWVDGSCGGGSCSDTQRQQTRSCTPGGCDIETQCISDPTCEGGVCAYDTFLEYLNDCGLTRTELGEAIDYWVTNG